MLWRRAMATNQLAPLQIILHKHTGMLFLMRTTRVRVQGTLEQLETAYRKAQRHNLIAGWWGVFSLLIMNPIALFSNRKAMRAVRASAGR